MKDSAKGTAFYAVCDLPERGQTLVFIIVKLVSKGLYQVAWSRELEAQDPLTAKDEMALQVGVIDAARRRLRGRGSDKDDIYLV